ncbi:PilZ domain-containing protein [Vulcaniibacterium tengchongense]|uniref:PilZ domain-containing protein n=1 Tax=Vulcaniibacterium tengchongense TaxID=1273429 RepID=A0A3N4VP47_9GAMM|nr:PilZ domain-containing protein [Vulcaniibacterium tengchongense]RPE74854.1 PilZ domain-containing protein [Vulcaniibacterium tengchongense]
MSPQEYRRAPRYAVDDYVQVVDTMTDAVVGQLGNISETGMLLIANAPLADDALYQLRFSLHESTRRPPIEVGAHLLWQERAAMPGQSWAGFRFIHILDRELEQLREWLRAQERAQAPG